MGISILYYSKIINSFCVYRKVTFRSLHSSQVILHPFSLNVDAPSKFHRRSHSSWIDYEISHNMKRAKSTLFLWSLTSLTYHPFSSIVYSESSNNFVNSFWLNKMQYPVLLQFNSKLLSTLFKIGNLIVIYYRPSSK